MLRLLCFVLAILLAIGCDTTDEPVAADTPILQNPLVHIPTNADWHRVAILQRNPLEPATFYIFPENNQAINAAYLAGKHFIFEFGIENRGRQVDQIRHYIIQPTPPFQDKDALQLAHEQETGAAFNLHLYTFLSEGWYQPVENVFGGGGQAVGLGVQFDLTTLDDIAIGNTTIGLIDKHRNIIGTGNSYISESTRLHIHVSR